MGDYFEDVWDGLVEGGGALWGEVCDVEQELEGFCEGGVVVWIWRSLRGDFGVTFGVSGYVL